MGDHMGFPVGVGSCAPRGKVMPQWRAAMKDLAACPNVFVKLSGLGMPIYGFDFPYRRRPGGSDELAAAWASMVHFCIELFGEDRCFFASNFPCDRVSGSYVAFWNAFKKMTRERYSPE